MKNIGMFAPRQAEQPLDQNGVRIPPPPPAPRPEDMTAAQNPKGFQLLVSYVNTGFEPREGTIKVDDTVRFVNNSTGQVWIAASGSSLYPAAQNGCGSSALDSCRALDPGESWEFTFTKKGSWRFANNLDKSVDGVIVVVQ